VDTRAITRKLRSAGVMMGVITTDKTPQQALEELKKAPQYGSVDFVKQITTDAPYRWQPESAESDTTAEHRVVVIDCGLKYSILHTLHRMGCAVTVAPGTMSASKILALKPDGILVSSGPGNPELLDYIVDTVKKLVGKKPIMGICLGSQLIASAFGATTFKMKFGHHGANHPVRDTANGKVFITAQNHGYVIDPDSLKDGLEVTYVNLNDRTVEGFRHKELPVFCIQYNFEASPAPWDSTRLFKEFVGMVRGEMPLNPPLRKGEI